MTSALAAIPVDEAGAHTLEIMAAAPRYAAWQVEMLLPCLGRRIMEVGSGTGNISACLRALNPELLVLTDTDPWYLNRLRQAFQGDPVVQVTDVTLPDPSARRRFAPLRLDSIVALNVLEHIEDDLGALQTMSQMVAPGGRVGLLVPALPALYGTMDVELQHFRRYTKDGLRRVMAQAGLHDIQLTWYNRLGILGWWLNARMRKVPRIPLGQLRLFDTLVPMLRYEKYLPLPFGQSLIAIGTVR